MIGIPIRGAGRCLSERAFGGTAARDIARRLRASRAADRRRAATALDVTVPPDSRAVALTDTPMSVLSITTIYSSVRSLTVVVMREDRCANQARPQIFGSPQTRNQALLLSGRGSM